MTKHVRVVFSCVEKPDPTSFTMAETLKNTQMTGVMYTIGTTEASAFSHKSSRHTEWCGGFADSYQQTNTVNRMVRMQLITQATSFNWTSVAESRESAAIAAMKSLLSSISSPQQLNCTAGVNLPPISHLFITLVFILISFPLPVNQNSELGRHFEGWITPPRGGWEQDPDINTKPLIIATATKTWSVIASKRRNLCGPNCVDRVYALEKRLICVNETSAPAFSGNNKVGESRQETDPLLGEDEAALDLGQESSPTDPRGGASTSGVQSSGVMACCVRKFAEKTVERGFEAAEVQQVGRCRSAFI